MGGAGNVALNIKALGATPLLCSVIGSDYDGDQLIKLLQREEMNIDGILTDESRCTTVKTRVIGNDKHFIRIDEEVTSPISNDIENQVITKVRSLLPDIDVLIFQDYNKGMLTTNVIHTIISMCNDQMIPVVVDPKHHNFFEYKSCTLFKPNRKEIADAYQKKEAEIIDYTSQAKQLRKDLQAKMVMTTLSEDGVIIVDSDTHSHVPAHYRNIIDVSGAGDSVLSVAALCVASKLSNKHIAGLSNLAGGLVCEEIGVVPINKKRLFSEASSTLR